MSVLALPVSSRDHIQGIETAIVTLVEYGDYQCPDCANAHGIIQEIQQQLGNQLRYVFRHFPCAEFHPQSQQAAEAAEAAAGQGKFWQIHDHLFANQHALTDGDLAEYAALLELDVMQFLRDMAEDVYAQRVQEDVDSGIQSGVCQTPTFFINRLRYEGTCNKEMLIASLTRQY